MDCPPPPLAAQERKAFEETLERLGVLYLLREEERAKEEARATEEARIAKELLAAAEFHMRSVSPVGSDGSNEFISKKEWLELEANLEQCLRKRPISPFYANSRRVEKETTTPKRKREEE